jgi:hypothetical protein
MPVQRKLGKRMPQEDRLCRTLKLGNYLNPSMLPPIPAVQRWDKGISQWGMMLNDTLGDCAIATPGHMVMGWTMAAKGGAIVIPDAQIQQAYSAISGYDPKTGENDNGCAVLDVLNYWRQSGIGGHNIQVYAQVMPKLPSQVRAATFLFGNLYLGMALPAMMQTLGMMDSGEWIIPQQKITDGSDEPYSLGGHAIPIVGYDLNWVYAVSWGDIAKVSWPFFAKYCDEAYACIAQDWFKQTGVAPSGFNLTALMKDLQIVSA